MRRDSWILAIGLASIYAGCGGPTEPDCVSGGAEACWTSIGPPGQWVTALAHTPWGLLAGTRDGGVFLRDPANGEWRALGLDHAAVSAIVVVPGSPDRVLVGMRPRTMERTPAAIFASQDTGRTWIPSDGGLGAANNSEYWALSLATDPNDPTHVYWAEDEEILRSTDGGRTWSYVYGDATLWGGLANYVTVAPSGRVWVAGNNAGDVGYVMWSDDGGASWKAVMHPLHSHDVVLADPVRAGRAWVGGTGGVLLTEDGGATWVTTRRLGRPGRVRAFAYADGVFYAASAELDASAHEFPIPRMGFYRSTDGGRRWESLPVPDAAGAAWTMLIDRDGSVLVGGESGLWRFSP